MKDTTQIDELIVGRVEPHIYAFTTNTVPNYLKVGDTYRPVSVRLNEWKVFFPELSKEYDEAAKVSDNVYFRDYSVHQFLLNERNRQRLRETDIPADVYYSREFFKDATAADVDDAIIDIKKDYADQSQRYLFYNAQAVDRLPITTTFARTQNFPPRSNQQETIDRFNEARAKGRTNLLMYAVMRFGKSFTSMCCATEMDAKLVVIVSAKADVAIEWKQTVQSHIRFAEYEFLTADGLKRNNHIITETIANGKRVAVFLTLQDLQGETIKDRHQEVFGQQIDLLLIDETHFGARAEHYGQVLRDVSVVRERLTKYDSEDFEETAVAEECLKVLNAKIRIHLSGTPYRILMGSEFSKEDIIAFYQFTDIVHEQEKWDAENRAKSESEQQEDWENPYFGFPQMIRFAFNPNESAQAKLKELRERGISYALSALLKPQSVTRAADGSHKKFVFEQEILDLLAVIDGSKEDENLLGFLDYDKIKQGMMCRHMVMVLPYCASCDAMESLLNAHRSEFKNLDEYEILNISGHENKTFKKVADVKTKIDNLEKEGKKTITLTVNRMLTGTTVKQWDTMLYFKDTASPQDYDQAIFRLQNQYVQKYTDNQGHIVKRNMKPQTILVDFDPSRMFRLQEQKAQIYNVNVDESGNSKLSERLREELRISPIIVMNRDKLMKVAEADILDAARAYSSSRGVAEETQEIPVDLSLMEIDAIRSAIEKENELGSRDGFTTKASQGEGTDMDTPDQPFGDQPETPTVHTPPAPTEEETPSTEGDKKDPVKQFRSYYARILFYAFLTKDTVISLDDVIKGIDASSDNARIAKNVGINKLVLMTIQSRINKFVLRDLDYKVQNINSLSHDTSVEPVERATVAIRKFGKLGASEVVTPSTICDEMVAQIPDKVFVHILEGESKILDVAGKMGEFAVSVYKRFQNFGACSNRIKDKIYTIPTSGLTYEFTRYVYEILGLDDSCVAEMFDAYSLSALKTVDNKVDYQRMKEIISQSKPFCTVSISDTTEEGDNAVKFDVVIGNPPYQLSTGGGKEESVAATQAKPLYHQFVELGKSLSPKCLSMIIPARWYAGGIGLNEFRKNMLNDQHLSVLVDYVNAKDCFQGVDIAGGICYFLWEKDRDKNETHCRVINRIGESSYEMNRKLNEFDDLFIRSNVSMSIIEKVRAKATRFVSDMVSAIDTFGLSSKEKGHSQYQEGDLVLIHSVGANKQGTSYIQRDKIKKNRDLIEKYKIKISIMVPQNGEVGIDPSRGYRSMSTPQILRPGEVDTFSYLNIGFFDTELEAINFRDYMTCKFTRFMMRTTYSSVHISKQNFIFVPMMNYTRHWTDSDLYEYFELTEAEISLIEKTMRPLVLDPTNEDAQEE